MLWHKTLPFLLAAALAVGLTACGGSDSSDVKSALQDYNDAVANKDAAKACGLLSDQAKKTIGGKTCEQTLKTGFALLTPKQLEAFKKTEIKNVKVSGDKATATITFPSDSGVPQQTQTLVKENGDWHLQAAGTK
jgi:NTF2-like N-terminal transpeptidase domain